MHWLGEPRGNPMSPFSLPLPPPSNTFQVPPGGIGILVRSPLALGRVRSRETARWESIGRCMPAYIISGAQRLLICAVYGLAPSHPMRSTNEAMLCQLFRWIAGLTVPALLGGDLNVQHGHSEALGLLDSHNLWRVSPDLPTTTTKQRGNL